jgi:hypothetical protein
MATAAVFRLDFGIYERFVLLDKEGRRLLQAFAALLSKLEGWDPYDQKMADTFDAIMHHMSVLIEQNK